jgi:hypothetical protein
MATFGVVGEEITDQIVIENILLGYFSDEDEPPVRFVQPPLDETRQGSEPAHGGWSLVLQFLRQREHERALQFNDYLVIQIDTDVSEQKGYDIPWRDGGRELSPQELVDRMVAKLVQLIGEDFYARHRDRFVFAIAVHQIECWLLPILFTNNKAGKITGCLEAADQELRRQNGIPLKRGDGKNPRATAKARKVNTKVRTMPGATPGIWLPLA